MSSTVISFIPSDSQRRISDEEAAAAERYLTERYAGSTEVQVNRSYLRPFFIDAGDNHESIKCPCCGNDIEVTSWQDLMTQCWIEADQGFDLSASTLKCCDRDLSPDMLSYVPDQGFAMVSFEVTDPCVADHSTAQQQLSVLLGTPMCIINAHY